MGRTHECPALVLLVPIHQEGTPIARLTLERRRVAGCGMTWLGGGVVAARWRPAAPRVPFNGDSMTVTALSIARRYAPCASA